MDLMFDVFGFQDVFLTKKKPLDGEALDKLDLVKNDAVLVCDIELVVFHAVNTEPTCNTESLCVGWQYLVWELFR